MTLNASGPISLAGTTTGQSIEIELAGNGTTQISLNDTAVRTLAGVASGEITMPTNFWGKSASGGGMWNYQFYDSYQYINAVCCCCCFTPAYWNPYGVNPNSNANLMFSKSATEFIAILNYYITPSPVDSQVWLGFNIKSLNATGSPTTLYNGNMAVAANVLRNQDIYQYGLNNAGTSYVGVGFKNGAAGVLSGNAGLWDYNFATNTFTVVYGSGAVTAGQAVPSAAVKMSNGNYYFVGQATSTTSAQRGAGFGIIGTSRNVLVCKRQSQNDMANTTGNPTSVAWVLDNSDNFYLLSPATGSMTNTKMKLMKYNSSGTLQWIYAVNRSSPYSNASLGINPSTGDIYAGMGTVIAKFNTSGTVQWGYTVNGVINSVFYDTVNNNVVFQIGNNIVWLDTNGNKIRERNININPTGTTFNIFLTSVKNSFLGIVFTSLTGPGTHGDAMVAQYLALPADGSLTKISGYSNSINYSTTSTITLTSATVTTSASTSVEATVGASADSSFATPFATSTDPITTSANSAW